MTRAHMLSTPGLGGLPAAIEKAGADFDRELAGIPKPVYRKGHDPETAAKNAAAVQGLMGRGRQAIRRARGR